MGIRGSILLSLRSVSSDYAGNQDSPQRWRQEKIQLTDAPWLLQDNIVHSSHTVLHWWLHLAGSLKIWSVSRLPMASEVILGGFPVGYHEGGWQGPSLKLESLTSGRNACDEGWATHQLQLVCISYKAKELQRISKMQATKIRKPTTIISQPAS